MVKWMDRRTVPSTLSPSFKVDNEKFGFCSQSLLETSGQLMTFTFHLLSEGGGWVEIFKNWNFFPRPPSFLLGHKIFRRSPLRPRKIFIDTPSDNKWKVPYYVGWNWLESVIHYSDRKYLWRTSCQRKLISFSCHPDWISHEEFTVSGLKGLDTQTQ